MFKITKGRGFNVTFRNGYSVSVQFGPGNYADNYNMDYDNPYAAGEKGSSTAECAVWGPVGGMIEYGEWGDTVGGHMTPVEVLELLNWAERQTV